MAADLVLKLNKNGTTTMPSTTAVRRVRMPAGMRSVKITSAENFYRQIPADGAVIADGAADTDADQFLYFAGTYSEGVTGNGETDLPAPPLAADEFWYFVPTVADQQIWFQPQSIG